MIAIDVCWIDVVEYSLPHFFLMISLFKFVWSVSLEIKRKKIKYKNSKRKWVCQRERVETQKGTLGIWQKKQQKQQQQKTKTKWNKRADTKTGVDRIRPITVQLPSSETAARPSFKQHFADGAFCIWIDQFKPEFVLHLVFSICSLLWFIYMHFIKEKESGCFQYL